MTILTLEAAVDLVQTCRKNYRHITLCHGTFDLLHAGHVDHLRQVKERRGGLLIVSITSDAHVNKGPNRPAFKQEDRAKVLAALWMVDAVIINDTPDARRVIEAIKPDLYFKGPDYAGSDAPSSLDAERKAVEKHGGKLEFTKDRGTFSSSEIINKHIDLGRGSDVQDFLSDVRARKGLKRILDLIETVKDYRVLLVGDYIKDEYVYVNVLGKSPKENMIAVQKLSKESWGGGAHAAAKHLAGFVKHVDLITMIHAKTTKTDKALPENVTLRGLVVGSRSLTKKTRYVERAYMRKLFEVYQMDDKPLSEPHQKEIYRDIKHFAEGADLIMVTDFGHGLINDWTLTADTTGRFLAVAPQTNSANVGFNLLTKYEELAPDYACLDEPEARLAAANKHEPIKAIGSFLRTRVNCKQLVITHGGHGCYVFGGAFQGTRVPALTDTVVDTVGAGDAFFSITAPMVKAGGDMRDIGLIGNAAGALKVGILGHTKSVTKPALISFIKGLLK